MPVVKTKKLHQLDRSKEYAVVCRTGNHSDLACQILSEHGFIDGIELGGAAAFLDFAFDAQVTLNF